MSSKVAPSLVFVLAIAMLNQVREQQHILITIVILLAAVPHSDCCFPGGWHSTCLRSRVHGCCISAATAPFIPGPPCRDLQVYLGENGGGCLWALAW